MTAAPSPVPPLLDGIVVLETGNRIAVGACGNLLVHLGAIVIAIEPAAATGEGKWRHRAAMMAGKRSVVTDGANAEDRALVAALAGVADVVLTSSDDDWLPPAAMASPRSAQVIADVTAYGREGPCAGRGGSEEAIQAATGLVDTTGPIGGDPVPIGVPVLETSAAVHLAAAILLALRVRRRHGVGQAIEVALADVGVNSLANFLALHCGGLPAARSGNRHPLYAPWGSYHAADGYLLACSVTDEQFARLCRAIEAPDLAGNPRYATSSDRLAHFRELDDRINAWAMRHTVAECEAVLAKAGVASGRIVPLDDVAAEPNLVHRRSVMTLVDRERDAAVMVPASPLRGDGLPESVLAHVPRRDEDRAWAQTLARMRRRDPPTAASAAAPEAALAGVHVVEIGHYTVAPLASRILGSFGADVVKVEPPTGDAVRHGPPLRADGQAYIFALSNTDKRGIVLDLREERDRECLDRLLARADILVENLRPGALARLGYDSATLRARHPRLVYCSVTGFGRDSVYEGRPALDSVIQAMSGMMSLTTAAGEPTKTGISASDNLGGLVGMLACITGLELRERTGVAAHFDISMQDASAWMTLLTCGGGAALPSRVLRARDGHVLVHGEGEALAALSADVLTNVARDEAGAALAATGFAASPVLTVPEVVAHPHTVARDLLVERPTSDGDRWTVLNSPVRLSVTPPVVRSVMPRLGVDDASVLLEIGAAAVAPPHAAAEVGAAASREP